MVLPVDVTSDTHISNCTADGKTRILELVAWGHNVRISDRVKGPEDRIWYASATIQHEYRRDELVHQIESGGCTGRGKHLRIPAR